MAFLKRRPSVPTTAATPGYSVIDEQLNIVGDLETEGTLRIDGRLRGSIRRADLVILGADAQVEGDVTAREVIVAGAVIGNIEASERTEVQASAVISGDIVTGAVLIHEGGAVRGRLVVSAHEERARVMRPTPRSMKLVASGGSGSAVEAGSGDES